MKYIFALIGTIVLIAPLHNVLAQQHSTPAAEAPVIHHLYAILRPNENGQWYVQNDIDHMPIGVSTSVEQTDSFVRIFFNKAYTHAATIQVTADDGFNSRVSGHANLGLSNATIAITYKGVKIKPADIVRFNPKYAADGNFWVNITMIDVGTQDPP